MTKYTNNEQYESDKASFIADIERFAIVQKMLHGTPEHHKAEDLADLLKQSKWIGAYGNNAHDDGYIDGYNDALEDD